VWKLKFDERKVDGMADTQLGNKTGMFIACSFVNKSKVGDIM